MRDNKRKCIRCSRLTKEVRSLNGLRVCSECYKELT